MSGLRRPASRNAAAKQEREAEHEQAGDPAAEHQQNEGDGEEKHGDDEDERRRRQPEPARDAHVRGAGSLGARSPRVAAPTGVPHAGQKRAPAGIAAPHTVQSAGCSSTLPFFPARLERTRRLGDPAPERPDERAVVGVGELARAMVELELAQPLERAVALLGQREAAPLELVALREAVRAALGSRRNGRAT